MPPKRKATKDVDDDDLIIVCTKKLKPNDSAPPQDKNLPYRIFINLHSRFDVFPELLRNHLRRAYCRDLYSSQQALRAGTPRAPHRQTYQILKGHRIRSACLTFTRELLSSNIPSLALANAALMEHLLSEKQPNLGEEVTFSHTKTQEGLQNPQFLELYSVRVGEIGWGVDEEGALSFYYTKVEGKCLGEVVWYVSRGEIKVEEDEGQGR